MKEVKAIPDIQAALKQCLNKPSDAEFEQIIKDNNYNAGWVIDALIKLDDK